MLRKQPTAHQVPAQVTPLLSLVCFCSGLVHGEKVPASLLLLEGSEGSVKAAARRTRAEAAPARLWAERWHIWRFPATYARREAGKSSQLSGDAAPQMGISRTSHSTLPRGPP